MRALLQSHLKKFIFAVCALVVAIVAAIGAFTLAYAPPVATSGITVIQSGKLEIELRESSIPKGGSKPVLGNAPIQIRPGEVASKQVTVKNTGPMNVFVRVKMYPQFTLSEENAGKPVDPSLISCDVDHRYWLLQGDYYYFYRALAPGEETPPIFTNVTFDKTMDNTYTNSTITFLVDAAAVPANPNANTVYDTALWPMGE
ncbi:MAG: hypothetical protein E7624_05045 [Ruminococcaceae bacterium]|nr:hypothetical protein [Oscillospiraceae bacterium]